MLRTDWIALSLLCCCSVDGGCLFISDASAQRPTPVALFKRFDLLGTFSWDCQKAASKQNQYFVHRALDQSRVQRDQMLGPTTRGFVDIWETGAQGAANLVGLTGTRDGQAVSAIYQIERGRHRIVHSIVSGKPEIVNGHFLNKAEVPWTRKCPS